MCLQPLWHTHCVCSLLSTRLTAYPCGSQKVLPHIVLAQAAMPHLKDDPSSSYLFITGRMGEDCLKTDEGACPRYGYRVVASFC